MIMAYYDYKMKEHSKSKLLGLGFRYYKQLEDLKAYRTVFPIYKYKRNTILECEVITFEETGETKINIYQKSNGEIYTPFYVPEVRNQYAEKYMKDIEEKINDKLTQFGITVTVENVA
jgi:hypothetical protein